MQIYYGSFVYITLTNTILYIRLSENFLSFYEEIIDAQGFLFYIILSNYVRSIFFCWNKHRDISQTFHVCERKTLFEQPNILPIYMYQYENRIAQKFFYYLEKIKKLIFSNFLISKHMSRLFLLINSIQK